MYQHPLVFCGLVLLIAICGIALLAVREKHSFITTSTQWMSSQLEGFSPQTLTVPQCPADLTDSNGKKIHYTFFTDSAGESLCCSGPVNSLSHTCTPANTSSSVGMCAFRTGVPDPIKGGTAVLPLCNEVAETNALKNGQDKCPISLPNYAIGNIGPGNTTIQSCCKNQTNNDGTDCTSTDLQNNNFCRIGTVVNPSDRDCGTLREFENATCPPELQKTLYTMGKTESAVYPNASGVQTPLCFGVQHSCYPDDVVKKLQTQGVFTNEPKDPKNWAFACTGYTSAYVNNLANPNFKSTYVTPSTS